MKAIQYMRGIWVTPTLAQILFYRKFDDATKMNNEASYWIPPKSTLHLPKCGRCTVGQCYGEPHMYHISLATKATANLFGSSVWLCENCWKIAHAGSWWRARLPTSA